GAPKPPALIRRRGARWTPASLGALSWTVRDAADERRDEQTQPHDEGDLPYCRRVGSDHGGARNGRKDSQERKREDVTKHALLRIRRSTRPSRCSFRSCALAIGG